MRKLFYLSSIIFIVILIIAGCSRFPNTVHSPEDVDGKLIGGLEGTPSLRLASEHGTAKAFFSEEEMMSELRMAGIDCAIMERTTANELVSNTSGVRILTEPLLEYELRFAIPLENTALLDAVNFALEELSRNGTLRGLYNRYFSRGNFSYTPLGDDVPRTGELTIALPPDSPPFSFKDAQGNFIGMDVDVAIAVSDILGVKFIPLEYDAWELVTAVWHGRADLALGWHPGEGEGLINISEPYARAVQVVIVRR
ncbi:MAG: transporter substrate-binding domain-containing protein [Oscillospiraceae bacterium]|nr:transporter substrate-binding domain-containing protein [Oscillospiraceae bacterium]